MLLFQLSPPEFVALITALVVSLTVHEYAHARVAFALGDLTAYGQGRLTLNPLKHLDPMGSLMMVMVGFGWARPVPVSPHRLGRDGMLKVAIAGPLSNLALACLTGLPVSLPLRLGLPLPDNALVQLVATFLMYFAYINIVLAVFNMIPIPPLDGWKVLLGLVPERTALQLSAYEHYGPLLLLGILAIGLASRFSPLWTMMSPFINALSWLILGQSPASP